MKLLSLLFLLHFSILLSAQQKTTLAPQRLFSIHQKNEHCDVGEPDSFRFYYSGNRASAFDFDEMYYRYTYINRNTVLFDRAEEYSQGFYLGSFHTQSFDQADHIVEWHYTNLVAPWYKRTQFTKNMAGIIIEEIRSDSFNGSWGNFLSFNYTIDTIANGYTSTLPGQGTNKQVVTYDLLWKKLSDITGYTDPSSNFIETSKLLYTYDPQGRLSNETEYHGPAGNLFPSIRCVYAYAGTNFWTSRTQQHFDTANQVWHDQGLTSKHLNAQMLPDTVRYYLYNSLGQPIQQYNYSTWVYNQLGNPVSAHWYYYCFNGYMHDTAHYYYENIPQTSSAGLVPGKTVSAAYPNPAHDKLFLPDGTVHAELYNMQGQSVLRSFEKTHTLTGFDKLPAGMYLLQLSMDDGRRISQRILKE